MSECGQLAGRLRRMAVVDPYSLRLNTTTAERGDLARAAAILDHLANAPGPLTDAAVVEWGPDWDEWYGWLVMLSDLMGEQ